MKRNLTNWFVAATLILFASLPTSACASITVLVGEPFGNFGTMMPVGHTAIFLDRVCANGPLKLRMCSPDEPQGVAIARYHRVGSLDWVASPIMQFLYASDRPEEIPEFVTADLAWQKRQDYRRRFVSLIVPEGSEKNKATGEWWESAGVTFNRRLWGYQINTTRQQDEAFVALMNADPNYRRYTLTDNNCANFAADIMNIYFPGTVRRGDRVADFGMMTPKQVARCVAAYGKAHPEAGLRVLEFPQLPGSLRRSRPVRGGAEAGLTTKRYLAILSVIQPEVPIGLTVLYLAHGRWQIGKNAEIVQPTAFMAHLADAPTTWSQNASQRTSR